MKKLITLLILVAFLVSPVFASAQTVIPQELIKQQLIQTLEALLVQLEAQLQQMLAQQAQQMPPVSEIPPPVAVPIPQTPVCIPNWQCNSFGTCVENVPIVRAVPIGYVGTETRNCIDVDGCGSTGGEPVLTQSCAVPSYLCSAKNDCG